MIIVLYNQIKTPIDFYVDGIQVLDLLFDNKNFYQLN